jgi:hypothetical protein
MINYIALATALTLSLVSGFYSVYGLTTLFAAAFWPVVFMGGALEIGKLVTASWLYNNWEDTPRVLKYYLTSIVIILMFISSMGTFGFLSKAHIEQSIKLSNTADASQLEIINSKINFEKEYVADLDKQISQIDSAISKLTETGKAASSLKAANQERQNRDKLILKKEEHVKNISTLTSDRIRAEGDIKKIEAEVGPVKYVAELIYGNQAQDHMDNAVRAVIILLVLVFDPLAVMLLIAANVGLSKNKLTTNKFGRILKEMLDKK